MTGRPYSDVVLRWACALALAVLAAFTGWTSGGHPAPLALAGLSGALSLVLIARLVVEGYRERH